MLRTRTLSRSALSLSFNQGRAGRESRPLFTMYSQDDLTDEIAQLESDYPKLAEHVIFATLLAGYRQHLIAEKWDKFWRENCPDTPFK
jgi:hypothetical protein